MRYNDEITLRDVSTGSYVDDEGIEHEGGPTDTTVFADDRYYGYDTWATAAQLGVKPEASVRIRTVDDGGQTQAVFHGQEYDIQYRSQRGEFTVLTLARHAGND